MRVMLTLAQVVGALLALLGLWLLAGPAWTALVGGTLLLVGAVAAEVVRERGAVGGD